MSKFYSAWSHLIDPETGKFKEIGSGQSESSGKSGSVGQKGEVGSTGQTGQKGDTGTTGANGVAGQKGDTGETGATGTNGVAGQKGETGETGPAGSDAALGFQIITASFDGSAGNDFDWATDKISELGVSSVTRESEGIFKVTFSTALASNNYTALASAGAGNHSSSSRAVSIDERTAESCTLRVERTDTGSQQDEAYVAVIILGM